MSGSSWFSVSKEGLAKILDGRSKRFLIAELTSNVFDTDATVCNISMGPVPDKRALYSIVVEDDDPNGFAQLSHAWTLFAESNRKDQAEKRGRFNLGEKLCLAICMMAEISSTTGTVTFDEAGRRVGKQKRESGSRFWAQVKMTKAEYEDICGWVFTLIPPERCTLTFNGEVVSPRTPVHVFTETLPTVLGDPEGVLRPTQRRTQVRVYEPLPGEVATIYEMGIPVVESSDSYHVDVQQKVPLNADRDNVTPAYLRKLRTAVANQMFDRLDIESANQTWVKEAMSSPDIEPEAVQAIVTKRFGEKVVAFDPSDTEANKIAVQQGFCVPLSSMCLTRSGWKKFNDIIPNEDETLGFDFASDRLVWNRILQVHSFPNQEVAHLRAGSWDVVCTPRHRWVTGKRKKKTRGRPVEEKVLGLQEFADVRQDTILRLAAVGEGGESDFTPQEAAVLAWIQTDGTIVNKNGKMIAAYIYQGKPQGVEAVRKALQGLKYSDYVRKRESTNWDSHAFKLSTPYVRGLMERSQVTEKGWTQFVVGLSIKARRAFLEACMEAEGHSNKFTSYFNQKSGEFNDAVRLAIYLDGKRPSCLRKSYSGVSVTALCKPDIYRRSITVREVGSMSVWCPETESGTWTMMTEDGQIMLTGNTVVHGRSLSKAEWENVKIAGAIQPAGKVTPSPKVVLGSIDGDGPDHKIPPENWTTGMKRIAYYSQLLAKELLEVDVAVSMYRMPFGGENNWWAAWGKSGGVMGSSSPARLSINLTTLSHKWFDTPDPLKVDALLIHEFAHEAVIDHLSDRYYEECCRLGALIRNAEARL